MAELITRVMSSAMFLTMFLIIGCYNKCRILSCPAKKNVDSIVIPLLFVALFALCIGHMFMTVYEMSIDTIFICFCEDFEENDGLSKPYYMSKELMEFVEKSHKYFDKDDNDTQAAV